jgi:hypothetical protein
VKLRVGSSSRDIRLTHAINIVSNEVLSDIAKATGAPEFLSPTQNQALAVSDELFSQMLNRPAPTGEPTRPFHRNSSLAEIGTTWLGSKVKEKAMAGFLGGMGLEKADPTTQKMFEEMANHMPLRALILFQQGQTSFQQLDGLLDLLNGRIIRGLWRLIRR